MMMIVVWYSMGMDETPNRGCLFGVMISSLIVLIICLTAAHAAGLV